MRVPSSPPFQHARSAARVASTPNASLPALAGQADVGSGTAREPKHPWHPLSAVLAAREGCAADMPGGGEGRGACVTAPGRLRCCCCSREAHSGPSAAGGLGSGKGQRRHKLSWASAAPERWLQQQQAEAGSVLHRCTAHAGAAPLAQRARQAAGAGAARAQRSQAAPRRGTAPVVGAWRARRRLGWPKLLLRRAARLALPAPSEAGSSRGTAGQRESESAAQSRLK
jgi:hypothetical protein